MNDRQTKIAQAQAAQKKSQRRSNLLLQLGIGLVALVIIGGAVAAIVLREDTSVDTAPAQVTDEGAFVVGNDDGDVTVQVVEDFQCPACQQFESVAADVLAGYVEDERVTVEYRGIAFLDRASSTEYASRALNASACVMSEGAEVWAGFHEQMFEQQPAEGGDGLDDAQLIDIAATAGADEGEMEACIRDRRYDAWVESTTDAAFDDAGVQGTPTVFVDGEEIDPAMLEAAVEEALAS